jgi:hypothetical protein
VFGVVLEPLV